MCTIADCTTHKARKQAIGVLKETEDYTNYTKNVKIIRRKQFQKRGINEMEENIRFIFALDSALLIVIFVLNVIDFFKK